MCIKNHDHMYASWDIECNRHNFLLFCVTFCPFTPLLTPKIKIWKKCKKKPPWRYYPFPHVYHKWTSYDVWFLRYKARWIEFFVTLGHFLPSDPPKNPKKKKTPRNVIILYLYSTNEHHVYSSCYMECDREFIVLLDHFLRLVGGTPYNSENQNVEKMKKKPGHIISHKLTINVWCMVPEIWSTTDRIFCHFGPFFVV